MISACTAIFIRPPQLCKCRPLPLSFSLSIYPSLPPFIHSFIYLPYLFLSTLIHLYASLSISASLSTYPDISLLLSVCPSISLSHFYIITYFTRPPSMFSSNNSNLLIPPKFQVKYNQVTLFSSYFAQLYQKSLKCNYNSPGLSQTGCW